LYATDLSGNSRRAFAAATTVAKANDATLVILHVAKPPVVPPRARLDAPTMERLKKRVRARDVKRLQELSVQAFDVMGCEGLARVDVFWTSDGDVVVNEINTMPGFTPHSMYPQLWAVSGVDYPALVDRLIQLALRRPTGLR